jgi:SAM-dependent methyltransferase
VTDPPLTHATSWRTPEAGETYERGRPDYPAAAIAALIDRTGLSPGCTAVDLAAGTGKLTRLLVPSGAAVVALEPAPGMLEQLHRQVPGALIAAGRAERIPLRAATADVVTVAQALHWFDPIIAIEELHRILRPDGWLAVVYNDRDDRIPWVAEMSRVLDGYEQLAPRPKSAVGWRKAFSDTERFAPFETLRFDHEHRLDAATFTDRIASMSFVILLSDSDRAALLAELRALVSGQDPVIMPMRTSLLLAARRP